MTEQLDYVAKIRAKGCANTGITEDLARELHARPGRRIMAIVELKVEERHEKAEGQNRVDLVIEQVEPATEQILEDHLRELTRTKHQNRVLQSEDAQLQIETASDLEPSVEQIVAARQAADAADRPHAYVDLNGECEVCEAPLGNPIHAELQDLPADVDDAEPATEPAAEQDHEDEPVPVA
jgi:hypothetical protein